jgi:hypothetical protein
MEAFESRWIVSILDSEDRKHENPEFQTSEDGLNYETPEPKFRKVAEHG